MCNTSDARPTAGNIALSADVKMNNNKTPHSFEVIGLDCPDCARSLESAIAALPGVRQAQLTYATGRLSVTLDPAHPAQIEEIVALGASMGHTLRAPSAAPSAPQDESRRANGV